MCDLSRDSSGTSCRWHLRGAPCRRMPLRARPSLHQSTWRLLQMQVPRSHPRPQEWGEASVLSSACHGLLMLTTIWEPLLQKFYPGWHFSNHGPWEASIPGSRVVQAFSGKVRCVWERLPLHIPLEGVECTSVCQWNFCKPASPKHISPRRRFWPRNLPSFQGNAVLGRGDLGTAPVFPLLPAEVGMSTYLPVVLFALSFSGSGQPGVFDEALFQVTLSGTTK